MRWAPEFVCAARGYWLAVFPRARREIARTRELAVGIPDPALRRLALLSLARKTGNLEGAAVFATLAPPARRAPLIRGLVACQALCDYLDVLCEQPCADPVASGYRLHEHLRAALRLSPSEESARRDGRADSVYLGALVQGVRDGLASLPSREVIALPLARVVRRAVDYQALGHGDADGSYEPFARWAATQIGAHDELCWWEAAGGAGSTLGMHVLMGVAAEPCLPERDVSAVESAYFPWVGALHSLLDSLVDRGEDLAMGCQGLIDRYGSAEQAAERMRWIAHESLQRTAELPRARRHTLIVSAMTCFYLCDLRRASSRHAQLVAPLLLRELGAVAGPSMAVLRLRRAVRPRAAIASHAPQPSPPVAAVERGAARR